MVQLAASYLIVSQNWLLVSTHPKFRVGLHAATPAFSRKQAFAALSPDSFINNLTIHPAPPEKDELQGLKINLCL